ncbi:MAG: AMP-binding protein [Pseudomonadota bacterium]
MEEKVINTLSELFLSAVEKYPSRPAFKEKKKDEFRTLIYSELFGEASALACALMDLGIEKSDHVMLLANNCLEWIICDLSMICANIISVPTSGDLTFEEYFKILEHSNSKAIFVQKQEQLYQIKNAIEKLPDLKHIIIMDPEFEFRDGENIYSLHKLIEKGKIIYKKDKSAFENRLKNVKAQDLATIVYTSGTTGNPKGVMLTHANITSNALSLPSLIDITYEDRFLSILPSWHMFERTVEYVAIYCGSLTCYTNIRKFKQDLISQKPTLMASVPRIWIKVYDGIKTKFDKEKPIKRKLIQFLLGKSKNYIYAKRALNNEVIYFSEKELPSKISKSKLSISIKLLEKIHSFADKLVCSKIRQATGGRLRAAISGGGSLPDYVDDFFEVVGITLLNGYGLTETSPVLSARSLKHNIRGSIGQPIINTEIKILDEKGNAVSIGKQGIIWAKGPQVMKGYYKNQAATDLVLKGEWFNTGDLGKLTITNDVVITGRAKDTIVLISGENVEPEPIEAKLESSMYISQSMVVGQDKKSLGAVIVPNFEVLKDWLNFQSKELQHDGVDVEDDLVKKLIQSEIQTLISKATGFSEYCHIPANRICIVDKEFELGVELTQTHKKKRNVIFSKYKEQIEGMYRS